MRDAWDKEYRRGRLFHRLAGRPGLAGAGLRMLDNATFRNAVLKLAYRKAEGEPQHSY